MRAVNLSNLPIEFNGAALQPSAVALSSEALQDKSEGGIMPHHCLSNASWKVI